MEVTAEDAKQTIAYSYDGHLNVTHRVRTEVVACVGERPSQNKCMYNIYIEGRGRQPRSDGGKKKARFAAAGPRAG